MLKRLESFIKDYQKEGIAKVWLGNQPSVILFRAHTLEVNNTNNIRFSFHFSEMFYINIEQPLVSSHIHILKSDLYKFIHPWLGLGLLNR